MKKKVVVLILYLIIFLSLQVLEAKKDPFINLSDKHKQWLYEVYHIITKAERKVFLKLKTDRERDILIKAFWDHRDPTNGTPKNEFKEEHYMRLKYVKKVYGRSKTRKGWQTDRGKIYIILGAPLSIQRFSGYSKIYPSEVWHYQVDPRSGLPPAFNIIFFDKNNIGEYVLYSPTIDGPQKLLIGFQGSPGDTVKAYEKLYDYNAFLAKTSISLVPGEEVAVGKPSMSSDFLLRNIETSPQKKVNDLYARKFLKYKGIVEVEYSVNYLRSKNLSQLIKDENGIDFFNYMIELEKLTVDQYEDQFYSNIELFGSLIDRTGKNIYQYNKTYNVKLDYKQFQDLEKSSFAIIDRFPIIPGDYRVSIVLKNTNSKEFTVYETKISVPTSSPELYLSAPLLAYDIKNKNLVLTQTAPFGTRQGNFLVDPGNKFQKSDRLNLFFQLYGASKDLSESGKIRLLIKSEKDFVKEIYKNLSEFPVNETDFLIQVSLEDFPHDYYQVEISLEDRNKTTLAKQDRGFIITPLAKISRPKTYSKSTAINLEALSAYILGTQYLNIGNPSLAFSSMQKAYHLNPRVKRFAMGLANVYFSEKKYEKIEPILKTFINIEKPDYNLFFLLGNVNQKSGKYVAAVKYYERLLEYHGVAENVLNCLASCYYNIGDKEKAWKAWKHSLKMDPGQEKVKKVLRSLESEK